MAQCSPTHHVPKWKKTDHAGTWKHLFAIRGLFIVAAVIGGFALSIQARAENPCPIKGQKGGYAVYVSDGFRRGVPWGGYHVTMTHFEKDQASKGDNARRAWEDVPALGPKPFSLKRKQFRVDYWAKKLSACCNGQQCEKWGIVFKSDALKAFRDNLEKAKFNVEQGTTCPGSVGEPIRDCFHISLYKDSEIDAVKFFKTQLQEKAWLPFLVASPPPSCQHAGIKCPEWPASLVQPKLAD
jgi:hypothetical protein